jgi:opacity protein-like surface antigen
LTVKHKLVCAVIASALLVPTLASALVFSVSPGQTLQGAQFGLSFGNLQPYVGLDLLGASGKLKTTNPDGTYAELSAGATLYIPNVGARFYFTSKELKPYVYLGLLKSVATVDLKSKTQIAETDLLPGDVKDQLTSLLGFMGITAGFGAEHPFSEHFSVGGEYGFRYLRTSAKGEGTADSLLLAEGVSDEITASLKNSMVRVVLNYKF